MGAPFQPAVALNEDEQRIVTALGEVWNSFLRLPTVHTADRDDFLLGVHTPQRIIMTRPIILAMEAR